MLISKTRMPNIANQLVSHNIHVELNQDGNIIWADKSFIDKYAKATLKEIIGKTFGSFLNNKFDNALSFKEVMENVGKEDKWVGLLWPLDSEGNISCLNFEFIKKSLVTEIESNKYTVLVNGYNVLETIHYYNELMIINDDLGEARDRFFRALSNAEVSLWEIPDMDNDFCWWSENLNSVLGYSTEEFIQSTSYFYTLVHPEDLPLIQECLDRVPRQFNECIRLRLKNNSYQWFRIAGSVYIDKLSNQLMSSGTLHNINERKEVEEKLNISVEELEKFAYIVSHDLQTPLRHVTTYASLIIEEIGKENINDEVRSMFDYMIKSADRMKKMIEDLLKFSRVGRNTDDFVLINGKNLGEDLVDMFRPEIESKDLVLEIKKLPDFNAREIQIRQVFQNLIENALKYAKNKESVLVKIDAQETDSQFIFSVTDNGPGIADNFKDKVFDVFKTLQKQKQSDVISTGIGLSIVKRICEFHGGSVWVENTTEGNGCSFKFSLAK